jgi:hypothetical protein
MNLHVPIMTYLGNHPDIIHYGMVLADRWLDYYEFATKNWIVNDGL